MAVGEAICLAICEPCEAREELPANVRTSRVVGARDAPMRCPAVCVQYLCFYKTYVFLLFRLASAVAPALTSVSPLHTPGLVSSHTPFASGTRSRVESAPARYRGQSAEGIRSGARREPSAADATHVRGLPRCGGWSVQRRRGQCAMAARSPRSPDRRVAAYLTVRRR